MGKTQISISPLSVEDFIIRPRRYLTNYTHDFVLPFQGVRTYKGTNSIVLGGKYATVSVGDIRPTGRYCATGHAASVQVNFFL